MNVNIRSSIECSHLWVCNMSHAFNVRLFIHVWISSLCAVLQDCHVLKAKSMNVSHMETLFITLLQLADRKHTFSTAEWKTLLNAAWLPARVVYTVNPLASLNVTAPVCGNIFSSHFMFLLLNVQKLLNTREVSRAQRKKNLPQVDL